MFGEGTDHESFRYAVFPPSLLLLSVKPEDGSIIFKIFQNRSVEMLIGMDQWRAVVNVAVKPRITQKRGMS
jgi:hypothetical protein